MNQFPYNKPRAFSARKVSADQAVKLLARNGILVNREKAEVILDFLYLVAKTYNAQNGYKDRRDLELKGVIEHPYQQSISVLFQNKSAVGKSLSKTRTPFLFKKNKGK